MGLGGAVSGWQGKGHHLRIETVWSENPTRALGLSNGKNSGLSEMSREGNEVRCITGAKRP